MLKTTRSLSISANLLQFQASGSYVARESQAKRLARPTDLTLGATGRSYLFKGCRLCRRPQIGPRVFFGFSWSPRAFLQQGGSVHMEYG
eukprot:6547693-Pyramimonas_sp.AAC.1